jgi:hypothetical protein
MKGMNRGKKEFVFIGDVALMDKEERVLFPGEVKRLRPLHQCESVVANPIFQLRFSPIERIRVAENREDGPRVLNVSIGMALQEQRPKQVIERASQVVNAVPDQEGPRGKGRRFVDFDVEDIRDLSAFRVVLAENRIAVTLCDERCDGRIESIQMFLCPLDLGAKPYKRVSDCSSS